ncbi:hypothetical protein ABT297_40890 [Dactylosporangium sp. NPDC000555]|uniref:hypothetical protein n=1 Tax=Dactylosporangium sp. NPDC000555 TaxID=3154260 RepID=UPI00331ECD8F
MSIARGKVAATGFAVVTLAAVVVYKFVLQPLYWRIEPEALSIWASILTFALAPIVPALGYLWLTRSLRRPPATFELSPAGTAFVVPESPVLRGLLAILLMFEAGNVLPAARVPDTDRISLTIAPEAAAVLVPLAVVLAVIALVLLWLPGPSLIKMRSAQTPGFSRGVRASTPHEQ